MKKRIVSILLAITLVFCEASAIFASELSDAVQMETDEQDEIEQDETEQITSEETDIQNTEQNDATIENMTEVLEGEAVETELTDIDVSAETIVDERNVISEDESEKRIVEAALVIEEKGIENIETKEEAETKEESADVPFEYNATIDGYTVSLIAKEGVFPEGTTVNVVKVTENRASEIENIVEDQIEENQVITKVVAFDITFYDKDKKEIEPEKGTVCVSITFAEEVKEAIEEVTTEETDESAVEIFHIDESENAEKIESNVTDEKVEFEAEAFTEYAIVIVEDGMGGKLTDTISWKVSYDTGALIISGTGAMPDFYCENKGGKYITAAPWMRHSDKIKSIKIEDGITYIGKYSFTGCSEMTGTLTIPGSVTSIGTSAFEGCSGLTGNLIIPNSVTSIGASAFEGCSGFKGRLSISNNVTSITDGTFDGCSGLSGDLIVPASVNRLGYRAFYNCSGFKGTLTIQGGVTSIAEDAFANCSGFTGSLTIPNSVKKIESSAFANCSGFTGNLNIPDSVTSIGEFAFENCKGFTGSLIIPNGVTNIGTQVFYNCSGFTGQLIISDSVKNIGDYAFYNCSGLTEIRIPSISADSLSSTAFTGCAGNLVIVIPKGAPSELVYKIINAGYSYKYESGYTGIIYDTYTKEWIYSENGVKKTSFTGPIFSGYYWYSIVRGTVVGKYTGIMYDTYNKEWIYANEGAKYTSFNGQIYSTDRWYNIVKGSVTGSYTGIMYDTYNKKWIYTENGQINKGYNKPAFYIDRWYNIKNGVVNGTVNGIMYDTYNRQSIYCVNGQRAYKCNSLIYCVDRWYNIKAGVNLGAYTGLMYDTYNNVWIYAVNGQRQNSFYGIVNQWCIKNGAIYSFTGLWEDKGNGTGWWYVENGKVNTGYSDIFYNKNGVGWLVKNGRPQFNFTGTYQSVKYGKKNIVNGKVQ